MTNSEAIRIINQYDCNFYWTDGEKIPTDDLIDAFELAVKALDETEPRVLTGNEIIKTTEVTTCYLEVKGERNLYGAYLQKYDDDHTLVVTDVKDVPEMIATRHARLWSAKPTDEQREAVQWQE